jgi:hypothetical protein
MAQEIIVLSEISQIQKDKVMKVKNPRSWK